ncbi:MAG: ArgE/DapE family deacylase [Chloroflexi bacterium]|nr:ArgE/DapE family deacylase [Chloroflexota bacterium]
MDLLGGTVVGADLDARIAAHAEDAFGLLERLVAEPSVVGAEQGAEEVLAGEFESLGFEIERLPIPAEIAAVPGAGVPLRSYEGRYNLVARRSNSPDRPSLLLNGHIDVVPAEEPDEWTTPPFAPHRRAGWLYGRGAGDMKSGFAMGALAIRSLLDVAPDAIRGPLTVLAAIEEECTGNGSLAAAEQGVLAQAVVLLEPTNLDLLLGGIGILWLEVTVTGRAAHAHAAGSAINAIEASFPLITALRALEDELNTTERDPRIVGTDRPFIVNVGRFAGGDWGSSVPAVARFEVRVGAPWTWTADKAESLVRKRLTEAADRDPWLSVNPPTVRASGFRAEGYDLSGDEPLARLLGAAHRAAHGSDPQMSVMGTTTDARTYLNRYNIPAICYGPRTTRMHGIDEGVELASIVAGAQTLGRFLAAWYAQPEKRA